MPPIWYLRRKMQQHEKHIQNIAAQVYGASLLVM